MCPPWSFFVELSCIVPVKPSIIGNTTTSNPRLVNTFVIGHAARSCVCTCQGIWCLAVCSFNNPAFSGTLFWDDWVYCWQVCFCTVALMLRICDLHQHDIWLHPVSGVCCYLSFCIGVLWVWRCPAILCEYKSGMCLL